MLGRLCLPCFLNAGYACGESWGSVDELSLCQSGSLRGRCSRVKPTCFPFLAPWGGDVAWLPLCIHDGIWGLMLKFPKTDSRDRYKKEWTGMGRNPQRLITVAGGGSESQRFWYSTSKQQGRSRKLDLHWQKKECCEMSELQTRKKYRDLQIKVFHFKVENKKTEGIILHLPKLWSLRWFGGQYFQVCY